MPLNKGEPIEVDLEGEQFRKLFIGGLSYETTEDELKEFYEQFGDLTDCVVMRDPHSKVSRGFGFVTFQTSGMLDDAQRNRPHKIGKREVEAKRAMPREDAGKPEAHLTCKRGYISGIKDDIDEEDLKDHFGQYGNLENVEIIYDKETKKPRGFAFVSFDDYDPVDKIALIKHHMIKGHRCDAKKALSKNEMNSSRGGRSDRDRGDSYRSRDGGGGYGGRKDSYNDRRGGGPVRNSYSGGKSSGPYGGGGYGNGGRSGGSYGSGGGGYSSGYGSGAGGGGYGLPVGGYGGNMAAYSSGGGFGGSSGGYGGGGYSGGVGSGAGYGGSGNSGGYGGQGYSDYSNSGYNGGGYGGSGGGYRR